MFNRSFTRILSALMLFIIVSTSVLPVYASGESETYQEKLNRFKTKICNECDRIFNDAQIVHDAIVDLYDDWILTLTQTQTDFIDTLVTDAEIFQYFFNSFTQWIKKNKLFGVQKEVHGVPLPDEFLTVIRRNRPNNSIDPNTDPTPAELVNPNYDVNNFVSNYPFEEYKSWFSNFIFGTSLPDCIEKRIFTERIAPGNYDPIDLSLYDNQLVFYNTKYNRNYGTYASIKLRACSASDSTKEIFYLIRDNLNSDPGYASVGIPGYYDNGYLYFGSYNDTTFKESVRSYYYNNNAYQVDNLGSFTSAAAPSNMLNQNFYNFAIGNYIVVGSSNIYVYYNGSWYVCSKETGYNYSYNNIQRICLENKQVVLDTTVYDNVINNYNYTINNIINNYPDISLDDLFDLIIQIDFSEDLEEIRNQLSLLTQELQEQQQELQDIRGILTTIKNRVKDINNTLTALFNRIDSLFTNTDAFSISVQLDNLFHHLEQTINNLPIPSGSGGNTTNFNFGDLDLHLSAIFTMNEAQQAEINAQINQIVQPFSWVSDFISNTKSLLGTMVARSAAYGGASYDQSAFTGGILPLNISSNIATSNDENNSSGGSFNNGTVYAPLDPPQLKLHLENANSDIDYGGEAVVLDLSWYAPYKNTIDNFIVVFCWVAFIWHVFRSLPGIIQGLSGDDGKED